MEKITIKTHKKTLLIDITSQIVELVKKYKINNGICVVYCPHTTAGITINEAFDPSVQEDIVFALNKIVPNYKEFTHMEGNSDSHTKTTLTGPSQNLIISDGQLMLGRWQGIYFCEYDGPRTREIWVQIIES